MEGSSRVYAADASDENGASVRTREFRPLTNRGINEKEASPLAGLSPSAAREGRDCPPCIQSCVGFTPPDYGSVAPHAPDPVRTHLAVPGVGLRGPRAGFWDG